MAKKSEPAESKYAAQFRKHFEEMDELVLYVLKGHLIMESAIDNIIALIFFHPEMLDSRMGFLQKVQIARAYALHESEMTIWKLVLAIGELRNEIAHNLEGTKRDVRLAAVRKFYLLEAPEFAETHKDYPDHVIVMLACTLCTGFLGEFENDITFLRKNVDALAAETVPKNKDGSPK